MKLLLLFVFFVGKTFAYSPDFHQLREEIYENFKNQLHQKSFLSTVAVTSLEQEILVNVIWDEVEEGNSDALNFLENISMVNFNLEERFRLELIKLKATGADLSKSILDEVTESLSLSNPSTRLIYLVASYEKELKAKRYEDIIAKAKSFEVFKNVSKGGMIGDASLVRDIVNFSSQEKGLKVYLFCRLNRLYPCLMMMKDKNNEFHQTEEGELWSHKALALSSRGLPSHQRNGSTPAGVWKINSVMPYANDIPSFGKFRRLILDFIDPSQEEIELKKYLPLTSHERNWWMPSVVARDIGRDSFRIHGTGKRNQNSHSTFYPFVKTAGCIAQRENLYDGVDYIDQRLLLDEMMRAMFLNPKFENETKIHGTLYVLDIDDEKSPVTLDDLKQKGIL